MSKYRAPVVLSSAADWAVALDDESARLICVDLHGWGGPCAAMEPFFRKLALETDHLEARLACYTAEEGALTNEQRRALPLPPAVGGGPPGSSSKPLFLLFRGRLLVGRVTGANAAELGATITDNLPPLPPSG